MNSLYIFEIMDIKKKLKELFKLPVKSKHERTLEWFCKEDTLYRSCIHEISTILSENHIEFYTDVCFRNFTNPVEGYYRFDFYIPDLKLIIECDDDKLYHTAYEHKMIERIKDSFCATHELTIARFDNGNNLNSDISNLVNSHRIIKEIKSLNSSTKTAQ